MSKRIILLLDGTWNDADNGPSDTNIVRLREIIGKCLDKTPTQSETITPTSSKNQSFVSSRNYTFNGETKEHIVFYERGVGTGGFLDIYRGGIFGAGLSRNIRRAYNFLSGNYEPGDQIFIFGFSRGSYTARSLVGYIGAVGLLKKENLSPKNESAAWYYYRTRPTDRLHSIAADIQAKCHAPVTMRINFLGVFETVGAMGIPLGPFWRENRDLFEFHGVELSNLTDVCLHALAIDEHRESFEATLWRQPLFENISAKAEQVWFVGAHSDIGGGYLNEDTRQKETFAALDDISLDWMLKRLLFYYPDFPILVERRVLTNGKSNRPSNTVQRLGQAWPRLTKKWALAPQHEPRSGLYRLSPFSWRSIGNLQLAVRGRPFEISICRDRHSSPVNEGVHISALTRLGEAVSVGKSKTIYAPRNLIRCLDLIGSKQQAGTNRNLNVIGWSGRELSVPLVASLISQAKERLQAAKIDT